VQLQVHFKGVRHRHQFSGCDVLLGPNGSGKSAALQAIQFALLGRVPGVGQRSLLNLSPDGVLAVTLRVAVDGAPVTVTRKLERGRTSLTIEPSWNDRTLAEREARLASLVGAAPLVLDFAAFASQSAPEQRRTLLSLAGSGLTEDTLRELCGEHWGELASLWHGDPDEFLQSARAHARDSSLQAQHDRELAEARVEALRCEGEAADVEARLVEARARWQEYRTALGVQQERRRLTQLLGTARVPEPPAPAVVEAMRRAVQDAQGQVRAAEQAARDAAGLARAGVGVRALRELVATGRCPLAPVPCPRPGWGQDLAEAEAREAMSAEAAALAREVLDGARRALAQAQAALAEVESQARDAEEAARLRRQLDAMAPVEVPAEPEDPEPLQRALYAIQQRDRALAELAEAQARALAGVRLLSVVGDRSPLAERVLSAGLAPLVQQAAVTLHELGREAGISLAPLGLVQANGRLVPWDGCSSGERTDLALALGVAMLARVRPPLRLVLVDNFECLDAERQRRVLDALQRLHAAGALHYAIVAAVALSADPGAGWEVHDLATARHAS
jgi:DNA repair exonuclease SbcCD ATPase subunit